MVQPLLSEFPPATDDEIDRWHPNTYRTLTQMLASAMVAVESLGTRKYEEDAALEISYGSAALCDLVAGVLRGQLKTFKQFRELSNAHNVIMGQIARPN